jgi:hypothetical protein
MSSRPGKISLDLAVDLSKEDESLTTSEPFILLKRNVFSLLHPKKAV